ncbi:hypothetical protein [Arthrobacter sp. Z4-13]
MTSMREWGTKHPGLLAILGGVAGGVLILAVDLLFARRLDQAIFNAVFYALFIGGGWYFTVKRFRKTAARLAEHGQTVMFLRYPNSLPGSLSGIWDMGVATPSPGRIEFQPAVYDTLVPRGSSKSLTGLRVLAPPRRRERTDSKQGIPLRFQVMALQSDGGVLEIAASPETLQKIQETLDSTDL